MQHIPLSVPLVNPTQTRNRLLPGTAPSNGDQPSQSKPLFEANQELFCEVVAEGQQVVFSVRIYAICQEPL